MPENASTIPVLHLPDGIKHLLHQCRSLEGRDDILFQQIDQQVTGMQSLSLTCADGERRIDGAPTTWFFS